MKRVQIIVSLALTLSASNAVRAQESAELQAARSALAECVRHVESGPERTAESKAAFERAERAFRAAVAAQPRNAEAHAGLGEVLSRCGVPHASMATIMNVVDASIETLQRALELDPNHWQARFILALNHFNMPAFLNRTGDAIRELETLYGQQRGRNDRPYYALTYQYLGDAYRRAGRAGDAQAAYAAGAKLFPDHATLQERARESGVPPGDSTATLSIGAQDASLVHALAPLRVEAGQHQLEDARSTASLRRIDIYTMPGGTGEMLQTLQTMPGATRAGDGADLYVRGGEPEETPVFVNGGRLAFPGRWEGLQGSSMGVLDASVLSKAFFSAGGFSARYGNALSGVVDVETQGRPAAARWRVGANLVSVGGSAYRPLGERAGAWATVMLTDVSLITRMQGERQTYPDAPRSYQAFAGGSIDVTPQLELKAVALAAGDRSSRVIETGAWTGEFSSEGQTQHAALSARWLRPDSRVGIRGSVTASVRDGGFTFGVLARDRTDDALGARVEGDVVIGASTRVRGGVEAARFGATTSGTVPVTPNVSPGAPHAVIDDQREHATHVAAYVEAERPITSSLVGVVGARVDRLPGETDATLDPRAAVAYSSGDWTLRAGAGFFSQGRWRRTYRLPDGGVPTGVPTRARHLVLGAERAGEPSLRVEAYRKLYDRFAATDGAGIAADGGVTSGLDAIVRWQRQSRLNGWITYSLLDATLDLVDGSEARARYDVTHTLTGVGRLALSRSWELGSTVRYATGKPFTPIVGAEPAPQAGWPLQPVYGATHADRLPEHSRVDGRITRYHRIGGGTGVFYLEMLNLTGRRNVAAYQYDATYTVRKSVESFFARRTFVLGAEVQF